MIFKLRAGSILLWCRKMLHPVFMMFSTPPGLNTDHSAFFLGLDPLPVPRGPGYWKMNTDLLYKESYLSEINALLDQKIVEYQSLQPKNCWENIKQDVKNYSIKFCKKEANQQRQEIAGLLERISDIEDSYDTITQQKASELTDMKARAGVSK